MKFWALLFSIIAIAMAGTNSDIVRYDNYKVYLVKFQTEDQFNILCDMQVNRADLDFWRLSRAHKSADIMVAPHLAESFLVELENLGMTYELTNDNVQASFDENRREMNTIS